MEPIFSSNLLSHYLSEFRLSSITDIRGITLSIKGLIAELESGKFDSLKEEEIKSRFVTTFFGDILGFNYGNSNKWLLREEPKSVVDGTKPDAALGYFYQNKSKDIVRAVIEMKDALTNLDEKQNRTGNNQTSIDQAFGYVSKMGGKCQWVIVSNIKEIRFYPSNDRSKCQIFFLKGLIDEAKQKEFLYLFHKDRYIKEDEKSSTDKLFELAKKVQLKDDKPIHIIDKIYNSLKRFDGLGFVDPNYLSIISPFNILSDHVWHYDNGNLLTLNGEIFGLLKGINIEDGEIIFTDQLNSEVSASYVIDAKDKIETAFRFLNHCLIDEISAIEDYKRFAGRRNYKHRFHFEDGIDGITKNIRIIKNIPCDCLSCNYRSLDFNKLLRKLKAASGNEDFYNLEYAFGNYLAATNNLKATYTIYKSIVNNIKGKEGKSVEYFLAKLNIKHLQNLILDYRFDDRHEILNDIKSVNLDKIIYDDIEFDVDNDVKKYLIDLKQDTLILKLQDEIEETTFKIDKLKYLYDNGGQQYAGPNLSQNLIQKYFLLYLHINRNFIIYDTFTRYKSITEKVLKGLVISSQTPEFGYKTFDDFILTEAILHIYPSALKEILREIDDLIVDDECIGKLLLKLQRLTNSYFENGILSITYENSLVKEHLCNIRFQDNFTNIFTNLFIVLSRLNISKEQFFVCKDSLLKFIKIEKELAGYDLKEFSNFILKEGDLFEVNDLTELLRIAIDEDRYGYNKYDSFIHQIPKALVKFYPEYKIDNVRLIKKALLNCESQDGKNSNYMNLIHMVNACNEECEKILFDAFENSMDNNFNHSFYGDLLRYSQYDCNRKDYFRQYAVITNQYKGKGYAKSDEGKLTSDVFINFVFVLYLRQIKFNRSELDIFTDLNEYETWLLNPFDFDYEKFNPNWLIDIYDTIIVDGLKGNEKISNAIEAQLKIEYNPILAKLKYESFK